MHHQLSITTGTARDILIRFLTEWGGDPSDGRPMMRSATTKKDRRHSCVMFCK
jgi:hypothetical protein